ncbi:MAG: DUF1634 domain-containing protein [Ammonifex sp.]|jgi:FtsH-binding integral membrane protein|nr:MAG: DUF1634 domain-containing protein [Ammonifex sp.]
MAVERSKAAPQTAQASPEQILYANIINVGMITGMVLLVISFFLYVTGIVQPYVPPEQIPSFWTGKAHEFLAATHAPHGWGWFSYIGKSDYMNFIGIALLAGLSILGYLILLPAYIRRKEGIYSFLVIAEIVVLVLAAAGIVGGGGH